MKLKDTRLSSAQLQSTPQNTVVYDENSQSNQNNGNEIICVVPDELSYFRALLRKLIAGEKINKCLET